jgi:hypothetical protein
MFTRMGDVQAKRVDECSPSSSSTFSSSSPLAAAAQAHERRGGSQVNNNTPPNSIYFSPLFNTQYFFQTSEIT